jgi:hypothetical protein
LYGIALLFLDVIQIWFSLVWFFLWLPEEVLALLFLLHRENGDFSILMKDIIQIWFSIEESGVPELLVLLQMSSVALK